MNRLPDGRSDEPRGWRDDLGATPIDALKLYLDDRFDVDEWAWAESMKASRSRSSDAEFETHERTFGRIREVVDRHCTPSARARVVGSYRHPSRHDPSRTSITHVLGPRSGKVGIVVDHEDPPDYGPARFRSHSYRYDFRKVEGRWRLDNVLALGLLERPIGGLF